MNRATTRMPWITSLVCVTLVLCLAQTASACPSCQQALGADGSQGDLARGIYYSILFMMSMPFAIVGAFGCMAYRAVQREKRRLADLEATDAYDPSPRS